MGVGAEPLERKADDDGRRRRAWLFVVPWSVDILGGVNEVVRNLAKEAAAANDYLPLVMVMEWKARRPIEHEPNAALGCRSFGFRLRSPFGDSESTRMFLIFLLFLAPTLWRLRRFIRAENVSVVNCHYPSPSCIAFGIARRLGWIDRLILSVHGADIARVRDARRLEGWLWRALIVLSDSVVACSRALARESEATASLPVGSIVAIHNGIDPSRTFDELASTPKASDEDRADVICVATLEHKKGIDLLFRAFEAVAERLPAARLLVVGRWSPYESVLRTRLAESVSRHPALATRVAMIAGEAHPLVLARIARSTVFVLPSRAEPFGLVLLEAGLLGTPVVATRVGGIPEIIDDGVHGLLVPPEDVDALAAALVTLLTDADLRSRLAGNLERHVVERFAWSTSWRDYCRLARSA